MSVKSQVERIAQNIANAYAVLKALGCDMPEEQNSDNLSVTAGTSKVVKYIAQILTDAQKSQARTNIGAASQAEVSQLSEQIADQQEEIDGKQPKGNYLTQHQDISGKANKGGWTSNMIIGTDANGNMVARATYTEAEKQALMDEIIDSIKVEIPDAHIIHGDVDSNNNIIIFGDLPDGTYILKYENEDGTVSTIGELTLQGEVILPYTNQIPISTDTDGSIFNGVGWQSPARLNSSGAVTDVGTHGLSGVTGFIPLKDGDVLRGSAGLVRYDGSGQQGFSFYDANKNFITRTIRDSFMNNFVPNEDNSFVYTHHDSWIEPLRTNPAKYVRCCFYGINENAIITVNEEIV